MPNFSHFLEMAPLSGGFGVRDVKKGPRLFFEEAFGFEDFFVGLASFSLEGCVFGWGWVGWRV